MLVVHVNERSLTPFGTSNILSSTYCPDSMTRKVRLFPRTKDRTLDQLTGEQSYNQRTLVRSYPSETNLISAHAIAWSSSTGGNGTAVVRFAKRASSITMATTSVQKTV